MLPGIETTTSLGLCLDAWLSNVMGVRAWSYSGGPDALPYLDPSWFVYTKVPVEKVKDVQEFCHRGFRVIDVALVFVKPPRRSAPLPERVCGDAKVEDWQGVLSVAERSFVYSRFHLDPFIPKEVARRIKREWAKSCLEGRRGERVLVAREGDRVVGFLCVGSDGEFKIIDLIAVEPALKGKGIGSDLVATFVYLYSHDYPTKVGTQAANYPSIKLYQRFGFTLREMRYVLHYGNCCRDWFLPRRESI